MAHQMSYEQMSYGELRSYVAKKRDTIELLKDNRRSLSSRVRSLEIRQRGYHEIERDLHYSAKDRDKPADHARVLDEEIEAERRKHQAIELAIENQGAKLEAALQELNNFI